MLDAPSQSGGHTPAFQFRDGRIETTVDIRAYRLTAVQKAAYKLAGKCTAILGNLDGNLLPLQLMFVPETSEPEAMSVAQLFFRELLDQELREQIGSETQALRALILAHAFSRTDLIERK